MPTKKTSTTSSMKRQTLGKAVPDNGRAAMKRMSGTPSPTSEATPFGDQTNGSTSTSSRRNSTSRLPGPAFARDFNLPTLLAHIQALTNQLEEMQSQVETWQGHAMSFRDQRDELRKTLLQLSEQRWIMQYNQARGRPLNEVPPLSEFTVPLRTREGSQSPTSPTSSSSSTASPPPTAGISSSFRSMAMDVEESDTRPSSSSSSASSLSEADRRRGSRPSEGSSSDLKQSNESQASVTGRRVQVEHSNPSETRQQSVQWEPVTRFVPHPSRGLGDPNVAPAPNTPSHWAKSP
ncbi:hypothetical protein BKA70DRAFT_1352382 [Coprinopsis sp. MPI-PUGE-AT-0042]|nr:hypothetical protein BKA70DRAFT_1352382 [Coprinopsis sp. MPI-PUGE-AT-0042]